jgi:hypothetical protein
MSSGVDVNSPEFVSKMDEEFRGSSVKDRMSPELRRKKFAMRFCHTPTQHAEARARLAANDDQMPIT